MGVKRKSQAEDNGAGEEDFPRGGRSVLSRSEIQDVEAQADAAFAREAKQHPRKKTKESLFEDNEGSVNILRQKGLYAGLRILGVVSDIGKSKLTISLPDGLHGYVKEDQAVQRFPETDRGTRLKHLFNVGQLAICTVIGSEEKTTLSLLPEHFHQGLTIDSVYLGQFMVACVKSPEDHGYVLSFGLAKMSGFLLHRDYDGERLQTGQLVYGTVTAIDKKRGVLNMSVNVKTTSAWTLKEHENLSLETLIPGTMVNARVQSVLRNGLILSFLTYFTGTVDIFSLAEDLPSKNWAGAYSDGQRLKARIVFVDMRSKSVGLTLRRHLLENTVIYPSVATGTVFEKSVVKRIDPGLGLLLELPAEPASVPGYVHIAAASDQHIEKLEKSFKEGKKIKARVVGFRLFDGLCSVSLKESVVEGVHEALKAGMLVHGVVEKVEPFGAFIKLGEGIKALCPLQHMSDATRLKPSSKFQVGAKLKFRVLECDIQNKKLTLTHKRTLVSSRLPQVTSYEDAVEGLTTHGWIHGLHDNLGCFVKFYNNVKGLVHKSELGLGSGATMGSAFEVGQVVKCKIVKSDASLKKISLSFVLSPRNSTGVSVEDVKPGTTVSALIIRMGDKEMELEVPLSKGSAYGSMLYDHLCDTSVHVEQMKSLLKPGYKFGRLLVIDAVNSRLTLSAKHSLLAASSSLPSTVAQLTLQAVIPGYVSGLHAKGCYVRFLGKLTGFVHLRNMSDRFVIDPSEVVQVGQSVRAQVLEVDYETEKISLSLKQSACFSTDASLVESFFLEDEKICQLKELGDQASSMGWADSLKIGKVVQAAIQEVKEYGVILDLEENDVVGFATHYQVDKQLKPGETVTARILDVVKTEGIVDLTLRKVIFPATPNKDLAFQVHQKAEAVVELVKDEYLVLSIPEFDHAIGYASTRDFNTRTLRTHEHYRPGQRFMGTICVVGNESLNGRLLLLLSEASSKPVIRRHKYGIGSTVEGTVKEIGPLSMTIAIREEMKGKVHVTEVNDEYEEGNPFSKYTVGKTVKGKILVVHKPQKGSKRKALSFELSLRPSEISDVSSERSAITFETVNAGQEVTGYVQQVMDDWAWLLLAPHLRGRLYILDSSEDPTELEQFKERFKPGFAVRCSVLRVDHEKKTLDLCVRGVRSVNSTAGDLHTGDVFPGRISRVYGGTGGLLVQVSPSLVGKVHVTHIGDSWLDRPDTLFAEGKFVRCSVLEYKKSDGKIRVDFSLRPSLGGSGGFESLPSFKRNNALTVDTMADLKVDMEVQGFVKTVTDKGCFVVLAPQIDAKVLLKNLSDSFVEDPAASFPVGKLVTGRIVSVEPLSGRVEMSLASQQQEAGKKQLTDFHPGDIVTGRVKRVEPFGIFIRIDQSELVGMCHVSEVSNEHDEDIGQKYQAGSKVRAKVLRVDTAKQRISLGMKTLYLESTLEDDAEDEDEHVEEPESKRLKQTVDDIEAEQTTDNHDETEDEQEEEEEDQTIMKADVAPLEVVLDDETEVTDPVDDKQTSAGDEQKLSKRSKKRLREEREVAIRAAEEKLLQTDRPPETVDDFEKLVRGSPNSSFVWIKYMAFLLQLAEVDKARAVAERALQTINFREEEEKMNVWIAYLNLENRYGSPPKEAVLKLFQRALAYCDEKKLHLSLLGIFEASEQHDMVDELMKSMIRKFRASAKVWLRHMNNLLVRGLEDAATKAFDRALASLSRHKHIKFITHSAILEFKSGSPDRGRTMFDGILRNYPKRTNIWSLYLDQVVNPFCFLVYQCFCYQEIRLGDPAVIRNLFERVICLDLPPKRMKFLFKRYLEYEKAQGDEARIEHVKAKAMEYVETKA